MASVHPNSSWHPAFRPNSAMATSAPLEASRSSWHPAFMPNAPRQLDPSPKEPSTSRPETPRPAERHDSAPIADHSRADNLLAYNQERIVEEPVLEDTEPEALAEEESTNEDESNHAALENLRSALTTSLGSPGGVEMEDHPTYSHDEEETAESEAMAGYEKADLPSKGPAQEVGNRSSAYFARTIPQDVDWGEDDEVDPEWNIQRSDTDPFKFMAKSDRSNSFPQVPPTHHPELESEQLAHNQGFQNGQGAGSAHDILASLEENDEDDFFSQQRVEEVEESADPTNRTATEGEPEQAYVGGVAASLNDGDRYEEGLPLVENSEETEEVTTDVPSAESISFIDDVAGEEEDFFSGISKSALNDEPSQHSLDRKSTMQVMNSLNFEPQEEDEEADPVLQAHEDTQTPRQRSIGGGIAVSKSTILSEVFGDPESTLHTQEETEDFLGNTQPSEEDLAAKWKAALDADEFLDEDGFLEDDTAPGTGTVDPATFFGSDDEGFLEDDEEVDAAANASFIDQASPSILTPVTGMNGNLVGFNNLTSGAQPNQQKSQSRYLPAGATQGSSQSQTPANPYTPAGPLFTNLTTPAPSQTGYGAMQTSASVPPPSTNFGAPPSSQRPEVAKAQSFVDKAKGGYTSPYDLPMEVVKPRKRASMQHMAGGYNSSASQSVAPPRSTSMYSQQQPPHQVVAPPLSTQSFSEPSHPAQNLPPSTTAAPPMLKSKSSFFEELPSAPKPKPAGRHTPQPGHPTSGLNSAGSMGPPQPNAQYNPPPPQPQSSGYGLIAPPQVSPYASIQTAAPPAPVTSTRYSPGPNAQTSGTPPPPLNQGRYAAAPALRQQHASYNGTSSAPPPILAHQPRTSSPLAHFERSQDHRSYSGPGQDRKGSSGYDAISRGPALPTTPEVAEGTQPYNQQYENTSMSQYRGLSQQAQQRPISSGNYAPSQLSQSPPATAADFNVSPSKRATSSYVPEQQSSFGHEHGFEPPRRSQTQSPSRVMPNPRMDIAVADPYQRPVSVAGPTSPKRGQEAYPSMSVDVPKIRSRGFSQALNYIAPTDGRELDPLQRWKGGPVFAWGVGGTVITSFPKEVPRYGIGQPLPMIICSPGEVKVRSLKDIFPLEERLANFPGPLKGKSKKKEVVSWLTTGLEMLERDNSYLQNMQGLAHEDKRKEERVLLWKILRVMIENDGVLEGNPTVNSAVRAVLSPNLDAETTGTVPQYSTGADLSGIHRLAGSTTQAEPVDAAAVDELRKHLLRGEREKAVWEAVDKRLWAHAMLISNTVSRDLYKQVAQEFVQKEVKSIGENTESLAALYEVFAGNFEESIDELVAPSARAGFQMVSTSGSSGPSKSALDGLDRWRETLGLILSNRSADDNQAINALGKLLSGYGRAEASHICFLFARSHSIFGGVDDPSSNIVLVGSDHLRQPLDFEKELEPVLLSEVYEYGLTFSATSNMPTSSPHLAAYKLQHATVLAEMGQRDKALQYCEAIASGITAQTRRSPYHHAQLVSALDDLSKRLKQSPKDESSSWISKPSIDKVSSSVWTKFNKFVAGDENDASSATGGESGSEVGPFARIAGGTPTISRSPSIADIYGSQSVAPAMNGAMPIPAAARTASRYAPGGSYTPPNPLDHMSSSFGSQPATTSSSYPMHPPLDHSFGDRFGVAPTSEPRAQVQSVNTQFGHRDQQSDYGAPPVRNQYSPSNHPYNGSQYVPSKPATPIETNIGPNVYGTSYPSQSFESNPAPSSYTPPDSYRPHDTQEQYQSQNGGGYTPPQSSGYQPQESDGYQPQESDGYQPPESGSYQPSENGGYQPPETSGYEPPSYEPATMDDILDSPVDTRPKKKSFMDDDEDDSSAAKPAEKTKAEKDREADEAFRKAAEADAQKASAAAGSKKGWGLGGWFGGAKKEAAPEVGTTNKPIKAKLGEASSFYYDPDLKRWVNKKAGKDDQTASSNATPPPPRSAGPPRSVSGSGANTPLMQSRAGSPIGIPRSGSMGPPPHRAVSGSSLLSQGDETSPEGSVYATNPALTSLAMSRSVSNSSGAGGPPSRPGTSMSNASSIDDLLGPPLPRKGGARKGGKVKKGRGYIDVMGDKGTPS